MVSEVCEHAGCCRRATVAVVGGTTGGHGAPAYELPGFLCAGHFGVEWHTAQRCGIRLEAVSVARLTRAVPRPVPEAARRPRLADLLVEALAAALDESGAPAPVVA